MLMYAYMISKPRRIYPCLVARGPPDSVGTCVNVWSAWSPACKGNESWNKSSPIAFNDIVQTWFGFIAMVTEVYETVNNRLSADIGTSPNNGARWLRESLTTHMARDSKCNDDGDIALYSLARGFSAFFGSFLRWPNENADAEVAPPPTFLWAADPGVRERCKPLSGVRGRAPGAKHI